MKNNSILITGVSQGGIGMAVAKSLSLQGNSLYLNGRNKSKISTCVDEINNLGGSAKEAICDLSDHHQVNSMMQAIRQESGGLYAIIHSAALALPHTPVDQITNQNWFAELGVILNGGFFICREAIPYMKEKQEGCIIFISSVAAHIGSNARSLHYSAAKAGLNGMAKHLALELAPFNIRVNTVAPALVDTKRTRLNGRHNDATLKAYGKVNVPLGRVAKPEDVAELITFLMSEKANYITGQIFNVDGGSLLAKSEMKPGLNK